MIRCCGLPAVLGMLSVAACAAGQAAAQPPPAALLAGPGVTAISGRVVSSSGTALPQVRVSDNSRTAYTDAEGRFLLAPVPVGKSVVRIDARSAGSASAIDYGNYELHVNAPAGQTTVLPYTSWLPAVDHAHDVVLSRDAETVVTTPAIPDLEIHIPAGTVIRDADGNPVDRVSITSVPAGKLIYPYPKGVRMALAFTIQPGAACLYSPTGGVGYARIVYPNTFHNLPRARETFWRYDPDVEGWTVYGAGSVSADGRQVIPDKDTVLTDFSSAECDASSRSHRLIITVPNVKPGTAP